VKTFSDQAEPDVAAVYHRHSYDPRGSLKTRSRRLQVIATESNPGTVASYFSVQKSGRKSPGE